MQVVPLLEEQMSAALLLELTWRLFTDDALLEKIKKDHFDSLKEI